VGDHIRRDARLFSSHFLPPLAKAERSRYAENCMTLHRLRARGARATMACEFPILTALQRMISFAHGTSLENARSMQQIGLNEAAARANSLGSHTPGAFFTHLLGPPEEPGPGLQMAYEWGLRHSPMPVDSSVSYQSTYSKS